MPAFALSTYRADLAKAAGPWGSFTTAAVATGPDPGRFAIMGDLAGINPAERWVGAWMSVVSGAQDGSARRVVWSVPEHGLLVADAPFGGTLQTGVTVEVSALPAVRRHDVPGWRDLVNDALRHLAYPDRITLATTVGTQTYALTAHTQWLDRPERLIEVYGRARLTNYDRLPATQRWRLTFDGGVPTLRFTDRVYGATFELETLRPAVSLINDAEAADGLFLDTNTAMAPRTDVIVAGLVFYHRACANGATGAPPEEREKHRALYEQQLAEARRLASWDHLADSLPDRLPETRQEAA